MKYAIVLPDGAADEPLPQLGNRTPLEARMKLVRAPRKPAGHPVLRAHWLGTYHEEWRTFLDEAYWNVELSDDVVPESGSDAR